MKFKFRFKIPVISNLIQIPAPESTAGQSEPLHCGRPQTEEQAPEVVSRSLPALQTRSLLEPSLSDALSLGGWGCTLPGVPTTLGKRHNTRLSNNNASEACQDSICELIMHCENPY